MRSQRKFAQHFLEQTCVNKLVESIKPQPSDMIVEIGAGRGALTLALAPAVYRLIAIEIDRDLASRLAEHLPTTVTLVADDFLLVDLPATIKPYTQHSRLRVVGNLPYNISSQILFYLLKLQASRELFHDATLMLQREVADRVVATAGDRNYGPVAIMTSVHADARRVMTLPPGAFRPAPRVHSAVVHLRFRKPRISSSQYCVFEQLVRTVFQRRRKTLLNAMKPYAEIVGVDAVKVIESSKIDPRRRPETLELYEYKELTDSVISSTS